MSRSSRNIVLCIDGTQNTPSANNTNVVRIFRLASEANCENLTYYSPGIGTQPWPGSLRVFFSKAGRVLDSVSGLGMISSLSAAYNFLNENYNTNDQLYFFGFSRGALTARLLAGVIHQIGLLPRGHGHLVPYAINLALSDRPDEAESFSKSLGLCKPRTNFLGLFDSVKSTLSAIDAKTGVLRIRLPYSWYNDDVQHVRHAMAIDEKRSLFPVNRWADNSTRPGTEADGRTVKQVWFSGDHCDVGGGHIASKGDLSVAPLVWMIKQAEEAGLKLAAPSKEILDLATDYEKLAAIRCNDVAKCSWLILELFPSYSPNDDDKPRWRIMNLKRRSLYSVRWQASSCTCERESEIAVWESGKR